MPRVQKKPAEELFDDGYLPDQEELDLEAFFDEIGPSTSMIQIFRLRPDGSRRQIGKTTMDQIREDPWEFLRENYTSGKFLLMFRGSDRKYHGGKVLEVEDTTNGTKLQPAAEPKKDHVIDPLLLAILNNMRPQQLDIGAMLAGMASIMVAMRPGETAKPVDPLAMFQSIVTMYQGLKPKEEKSELDRLRDVASVIKEFSGEGKGGDGIESGWGALAEVGKTAVDKLSPVLASMAGAPPMIAAQSVPGQVGIPSANVPMLQPRPNVVALPGNPNQNPNGVTIVQPAAGQAPLSAEENLKRWCERHISFLKPKAIAQKDPEFWADYSFENEEEPPSQAVLYVIRHGATFENLLAFDPEIAQNPQLNLWFKIWFDRVNSNLLQTPMDTGGPGGDPGNAVPDAGTRPEGLSVPVRPVAGVPGPVAVAN